MRAEVKEAAVGTGKERNVPAEPAPASEELEFNSQGEWAHWHPLPVPNLHWVNKGIWSRQAFLPLGSWHLRSATRANTYPIFQHLEHLCFSFVKSVFACLAIFPNVVDTFYKISLHFCLSWYAIFFQFYYVFGISPVCLKFLKSDYKYQPDCISLIRVNISSKLANIPPRQPWIMLRSHS